MKELCALGVHNYARIEAWVFTVNLYNCPPVQSLPKRVNKTPSAAIESEPAKFRASLLKCASC